MQHDRTLALIATSIAGTAMMVSTFQAFISWQSLQQYRESFLFSKRAEVCVDFMRDASQVTEQLNIASSINARDGWNSDRYSNAMNRLGGMQAELNGHVSFVILGTQELAADAEALEGAIGNAVAVANHDGVAKPQIDEAIARIAEPRARLQNACMALARGGQ